MHYYELGQILCPEVQCCIGLAVVLVLASLLPGLMAHGAQLCNQQLACAVLGKSIKRPLVGGKHCHASHRTSAKSAMVETAGSADSSNEELCFESGTHFNSYFA